MNSRLKYNEKMDFVKKFVYNMHKLENKNLSPRFKETVAYL